METVKQDPNAGSAPVITALALKSLADSSNSLQLLHRYEISLDRQYSRALNNLLKVRAARNAALIEDPPPPDMPIEAAAFDECEAEPKQEVPKEPNLPPQSPASKHPNGSTSTRNLVTIPQRRPISTSPTPKRAVPTPPPSK